MVDMTVWMTCLELVRIVQEIKQLFTCPKSKDYEVELYTSRDEQSCLHGQKTFLSLQVNPWEILPSSNSTLNLVTGKLIGQTNYQVPHIWMPDPSLLLLCCQVRKQSICHTTTHRNQQEQQEQSMCVLINNVCCAAPMTLGLKQSMSRPYQWVHPPMPFLQMVREHVGLLRNIMMIFNLSKKH